MTRILRSLLFAPANRPDLMGKFGRVEADGYVLDLEDGTPPDERPGARADLPRAWADARASVGHRADLMVRVNAADTPDFTADCEAVRAAGCDRVVLSKAEIPEQVRATAAQCAAQVLVGIESVAGVMAAEALAAAPDVFAVFFGAEDYIADLGGLRTREGFEVLYPRSRVAMAARLAGVQALDQVTVDLRDDDLFRSDTAAGRALGYTGKMCLTPGQVALANAAWGPDAAAVAEAQALIDAYEAATRAGHGTISHKGRMIDGPVLKQARAVVEQGQRAGG